MKARVRKLRSFLFAIQTQFSCSARQHMATLCPTSFYGFRNSQICLGEHLN
jgi:hypothetical protein